MIGRLIRIESFPMYRCQIGQEGPDAIAFVQAAENEYSKCFAEGDVSWYIILWSYLNAMNLPSHKNPSNYVSGTQAAVYTI